MSWNYTSDDLKAALRSVGVCEGSVILAHVSIGLLGLNKECKTELDYCVAVHRAIRDVIGEAGTILVPTYSYSFCKGELFDPNTTASTIGPFTEYFRKLPGTYRSREPIFSVCGEGPRKMEFLASLPHSCFGPDCVYDRLVKRGGIVCTLGLGLHYATFRHHIEELVGVPFRYRKRFCGTLRDNGLERYEEWSYFVSILAENGLAEGHPLEEILKREGHCKVAPIARSFVMAISAQEYFNRTQELILKNPWLTARGPADDPVALEDKRVGKIHYQVPPFDSLSRDERISILSKIPLHTVSDGTEAVMNAIALYINAEIKTYLTGCEVNNCLVPEKWIGVKGTIATVDGVVITSTDTGSVALADYSLPFNGGVSKDELLQHLYADENTTLESKRKWGFRCSNEFIETLNAAWYQVSIESKFSYSRIYLLRAQASESTAPRKVATLRNIPHLVDCVEEYHHLKNFELIVVPDERWVALL